MDVFSGGAFKDKSFGEDLCSRGACKGQSFREDSFSGGAFKDKSCGKDVFSGGACKEEPFRGNCLAEVLSRISHAGRTCLAEVL